MKTFSSKNCLSNLGLDSYAMNQNKNYSPDQYTQRISKVMGASGAYHNWELSLLA